MDDDVAQNQNSFKEYAPSTVLATGFRRSYRCCYKEQQSWPTLKTSEGWNVGHYMTWMLLGSVHQSAWMTNSVPDNIVTNTVKRLGVFSYDSSVSVPMKGPHWRLLGCRRTQMVWPAQLRPIVKTTARAMVPRIDFSQRWRIIPVPPKREIGWDRQINISHTYDTICADIGQYYSF